MNSVIRKVKIRNTENGEVFLDYGRVSSPSVFRNCLLKSMIQSADADVTLIIDTNLRIAGKPVGTAH